MGKVFRAHCKYIVAPLHYIIKEDITKAREGTLASRPTGPWSTAGPLSDYMARMHVRVRDELGIYVKRIDCTDRTAKLVGARRSPTWRLELAYVDKLGREDKSKTITDEDFLRVAKLYLPNHPQCYVSH